MAISSSVLNTAVAAVAMALCTAASARADIVFDFAGVCDPGSGCTGTATGVLTLTDSFAFGAQMTPAELISFVYSSSSQNFEITSSSDLLSIDGYLKRDGSSSGVLISGIVGQNVSFLDTDASTAWGSGLDFGESSKFTLVGGAVPEPSTWAMMLLGFAGLGLSSWRSGKTVGWATRGA